MENLSKSKSLRHFFGMCTHFCFFSFDLLLLLCHLRKSVKMEAFFMVLFKIEWEQPFVWVSVIPYSIVNPQFVVLAMNIRYNCVIDKMEIYWVGCRQINKRKTVLYKVRMEVKQTEKQKENDTLTGKNKSRNSISLHLPSLV